MVHKVSEAREAMGISVGGFTPKIAKVERGRWPDPPSTDDYEAMVSVALATTQEMGVLDGVALASLNTALLAASMRADAEMMEMLLLRGANHSCVDDQIRAPSHHAARSSGDAGVAAMSLLTDCGADVEARDLRYVHSLSLSIYIYIYIYISKC
jgi:hypothetical protein